MNIEKIKKIVNSGQPDVTIRSLLLLAISEDERAIPDLLGILEAERVTKKELITELNFQLSRADTIIESPELNKDKFVRKEIASFYKKFAHLVSHCYRQPADK